MLLAVSNTIVACEPGFAAYPVTSPNWSSDGRPWSVSVGLSYALTVYVTLESGSASTDPSPCNEPDRYLADTKPS